MLINRRESYLTEAARLREAAEKIDSLESRAGLLEMAAKYEKLAEEAPEVEVSDGPGPLVIKPKP
jgi:hypothetical protein